MKIPEQPMDGTLSKSQNQSSAYSGDMFRGVKISHVLNPKLQPDSFIALTWRCNRVYCNYSFCVFDKYHGRNDVDWIFAHLIFKEIMCSKGAKSPILPWLFFDTPVAMNDTTTKNHSKAQERNTDSPHENGISHCGVDVVLWIKHFDACFRSTFVLPW